MSINDAAMFASWLIVAATFEARKAKGANNRAAFVVSNYDVLYGRCLQSAQLQGRSGWEPL